MKYFLYGLKNRISSAHKLNVQGVPTFAILKGNKMIAKIVGIAHPEKNDSINIFPTLRDENDAQQIWICL